MDQAVQTQPLKPVLPIMLKLQTLDDQIGSFSRKKKALDDKVAASEARLSEARGIQDKAKQDNDNRKKQRGLLELEVKAKEDEIIKHNQQLNDCKSNEAYSAKLTEIKNTKTQRQEIEERIVQLMEGEEEAQKEYEAQALALKESTAEAEKEKAQAVEEQGALDKEMETFKEERASLVAQLNKEHSELYERRRANRAKIVGEVSSDSNCSCCSMKVPAHQINEIRKFKQFQHCQSCGVILVIDARS